MQAYNEFLMFLLILYALQLKASDFWERERERAGGGLTVSCNEHPGKAREVGFTEVSV